MRKPLVISAAIFLIATSAVAPCSSAEPPGPGVVFNGAGSYGRVVRGDSFDSEAFTVATWVNPRSVVGSQVLLNRGQANEQFNLYFFRGRVRMLVEYQPGKYTYAQASLPLKNAWTHYAGTYDGREIKIYANGKLQDTVKAKGRVPPSKTPLYFGSVSPGERVLDGRLEDIRFYRRALTANEIASLMTQAAKTDDALVGHWTSSSLSGKQWKNLARADLPAEFVADFVAPPAKDDGYRGIWYSNQPQKDEYVYKYSGGLGTYCSSHNPFAIYRPEVKKTFFCFGGTVKGRQELLHEVSYYDHHTGKVPRPTIICNKRTSDAHDNPVISMDAAGHIWIFSSSHGTSRPSYLWVSKRPYDVESFDRVLTTNFSYTQPYYLPGQGFLFLQTLYSPGRFLYFQTSPDGRQWTEPVRYAAIDQGHYQVSWSDGKKVACAFNFHPSPQGLNWRTNLYYMETADFGRSWRNIQGERLELPLTTVKNGALVHDYQPTGLKVYVQDLNFDSAGRPVVLYTTSRGYESGPVNDPRTWTTAYWNGTVWEIRGSIVSDNNYDMGSIYLESADLWRIIGPTEPGPQAYNTSGEIAMWTSADRGATWTKIRQLTSGSKYNHGYCRRPVNAHPDFYALWADGHGREPSESRLYFCDREGNVRVLPTEMKGDFARPELLTQPPAK